jgi:hypothetical protein
MRKLLLVLSLSLNIILILFFIWNNLNKPSDKLGVLQKEIEIGDFMGNGAKFILPKGITVRNKSERGLNAIGQFENNRFYIVITSDRELVDYDIENSKLNNDGNYYSADFKKYLTN